MNHETDHDQLLADVMAEDAPADFRAAALGRTLRVVRRRRQMRHALRAAAVLVFLGIATFWYFRNPRPNSSMPLAVNPTVPYRLIQTQSLPVTALVSTRPLAAQGFALTAIPVGLVETSPTSGGFNEINDDQLLALVSARPAMLVRLTPTLEQLVFVNPEDEKGFPAN